MVDCFYCGRPLYEEAKPPAKKISVSGVIEKLIPAPRIIDWPRKTRDHVIPKSRGGGQHPTIVPACGECNQEKGRLTIEEYRAVLGFRYGYISNIEYKFPGEQNEAS